MKEKELTNFFKNTFIFSSLDNVHYSKLKSIGKVLKYNKNEIIFNEGEKAKGFYIVKSGKVKIYKISFEGKEYILHIFGKNEPFGEVPAFVGGKFPANAEALEDTEVIYFDKELFFDLLKRFPEISLKIIGLLSKRLYVFTKIIESLSLKEVPSRLSEYLLYLLKKNNEQNEFELEIPKKMLANVLGTTPETLSRIFLKFKNENIIEMNGSLIKILDIDKLKEYSEGLLK